MFEEKIIWHEIVTRPPTEEEDEEFQRIYGEPLCFVFDCPIPDDGQEILVATKHGVDKDICYKDYGTYLEGREWDDIIAWAAMPKYKDGAE